MLQKLVGAESVMWEYPDNALLKRLGVNLSDSNLDEFERDWNKGLSIEEFRQYAKQELRKHFYEKNAQRK